MINEDLLTEDEEGADLNDHEALAVWLTIVGFSAITVAISGVALWFWLA